MRFAAIDIGSNAIRLLIEESVVLTKDDYYFKKISLTRIPIRLGKDVFSKGFITKKSEKKLVQAFKAFKLLMKINEVHFYRACATSAMREATNGNDICQSILKETNINLEIISGKEEAKLIFSNFHLSSIDASKNYVFIDVGGGSTELSLIENNIKTSSKSFRIGSVRYLTGKEADDVKLQMKLWLKEKYTKSDEIRAIGTGGSINKLYNISKHDFNAPMTYQNLCNIIDHISNYNYEDRIRILKLKPDRADVIIPSGEIYKIVMQSTGANEIIVPKVGLSDGIIYNLFLDKELSHLND